MRFRAIPILTVIACLALGSTARADRTKAAREAAEYLLKKFGAKAAGEGAEQLSIRIAGAASRHGDDAIHAVRAVGAKAITLADDAGEHGAKVMRLLARHGDEAAELLARPQGMRLFAQYGDDAAEALLRHKGIAEPVLEQFGTPAVRAMKAIGPQSGRRLAMLADGGELEAIGRTPELMGVIARYGDAAMKFIWEHKKELAGAAALTAFLNDPAPFIDGTKELAMAVAAPVVAGTVQVADSVAREAIAPLAAATGKAIEETARASARPLAMLLAAAGGMGLLTLAVKLHGWPKRGAGGGSGKANTATG
jgi:hypothetical protein